MSAIVEDSVVIDGRASDFAFHVSQGFRRLLMDRAVALVRQAGESMVTVEHLEACIDHALFDDLCKRIKERAYDRTAPKEEPASDDRRKPLSQAAHEALDEAVNELTNIVDSKARQFSKADVVTADDIHHALKWLSFPDERFADAQKIVARALDENRRLEWASYGIAVVLFLFGLVLLVIGAAFGDSAARSGALFSGSIVEMLILMPFRVIVNSRRENIALNMLGIILDRVDDPQKLATLLLRFLSVYIDGAHFKGVD